MEDVDDLAEAAGVDGIPFAAGPEHVAMLEPGGQDEPDLLAQEFFDELVAVVPWRRAGDEDALRVARHQAATEIRPPASGPHVETPKTGSRTNGFRTPARLVAEGLVALSVIGSPLPSGCTLSTI